MSEKRYNTFIATDNGVRFECRTDIGVAYMTDEKRMMVGTDYFLRTKESAIEKMMSLVDEGYMTGICEYIE